MHICFLHPVERKRGGGGHLKKNETVRSIEIFFVTVAVAVLFVRGMC